MATGRWSVGLCSCVNDLSTCCLTCFLPCVTFGRIAEAVDDGHSSCRANCCIYGLLMGAQLQWLYSCTYRKKMRSKFGLESEPCSDCCVHFWCEPFALCQEHAELQNRGLVPFKGFAANARAAPGQQAMSK